MLEAQKISKAKELHKQIDGHAPGLRGDDPEKYIQAGITTDLFLILLLWLLQIISIQISNMQNILRSFHDSLFYGTAGHTGT